MFFSATWAATLRSVWRRIKQIRQLAVQKSRSDFRLPRWIPANKLGTTPLSEC